MYEKVQGGRRRSLRLYSSVQGDVDSGIAPPVEAPWIDDLGNEFVDDLGVVIVFTS